jgi:hypothetical protein
VCCEGFCLVSALCSQGGVGKVSFETKALSMRLLRFNFPALLHLLNSFPQAIGLIGHLAGQDHWNND